MQEVKPPKKPLLYYYCIAMLVLLVLNAFLFPRLMSAQVEEVGNDGETADCAGSD